MWSFRVLIKRVLSAFFVVLRSVVRSGGTAHVPPFRPFPRVRIRRSPPLRAPDAVAGGRRHLFIVLPDDDQEPRPSFGAGQGAHIVWV